MENSDWLMVGTPVLTEVEKLELGDKFLRAVVEERETTDTIWGTFDIGGEG